MVGKVVPSPIILIDIVKQYSTLFNFSDNEKKAFLVGIYVGLDYENQERTDQGLPRATIRKDME